MNPTPELQMPLTGGWILHDPLWLLLWVALPLLAALRGRRGQRVVHLPFVASWMAPHSTSRSRLPVTLMYIGLALLTVALARPQRVEERQFVHQEGYDIVLAIDISGSMLAEDYERAGRRTNRLQAIKPIIEAFIDRRSSDRIGVVAFGGKSYTLAPLSFDHSWLRRQVERLRIGLVEDGTAIGDALALSISRLGQANREEGGKRMGGFVILLTDGANNSGAILPLDAAEIARAKGIPVYTIGAGQEGIVPMPVFDDQGNKRGYQNMRSDLDETTLRAIADSTGGSYFRAMDSNTVDDAFAAIDSAHKIEFDAKSNLRAQELFNLLAWPGAGLVALASLLARLAQREVLA